MRDDKDRLNWIHHLTQYTFLTNFFAEGAYPEYANNDFYITGESCTLCAFWDPMGLLV